MRRQLSKRRIGSLLASVVFFVAVIVAALNVQYIQDRALYHQYDPTSAVASLATDAGMSDHGTFLFYVSHPALQDAQTFNQQCEKRENSTAILGCYDGHRIYIYDITDPRLEGVRPTTAAHEMLHAAYRRLSAADKASVNALLDDEYEKFKDNEELAGRMAFYARTQPGERENELHSIIGTEIRDISPELEKHYSRYFSDRTKVVAQHEQYHSVFEGLRTKSEALNKKIDQLEEDIKNQTAAYTPQSSEVGDAIANFNARAQQGEFTSQSAFNQERQALMARSSELEGMRVDINQAISEYNALIAEVNSIALETDTLNRSMNSQLAPAPSL